MAYTTINKSTDYFNTKLYTGNNNTSQNITGVGFQPDLIWIKNRDNVERHHLADAVRGNNKFVHSDSADAERTGAYSGGNTQLNFASDGFNLVSNGSADELNFGSRTYASWNWKAGTTGSGSTTGSGTSKTYNYSVNTTARFSITKYTGNGNGGHTIPHSLGTTPKIVIVKELGASDYWRVYHPALTANYNVYLNTNHAQDSASDGYIASVGSTTFGFGGASNTNTVNQDGIDYIAYCFADVTGYSKFGSYEGNNNSDGTFIYTGFKPNFVITKNIDATADWILFDDARKTPAYNGNLANSYVYPSTNGAEGYNTTTGFDLLSNGFKMRNTFTSSNAANTYIYMAFGQSLVGSNNIPCTAR